MEIESDVIALLSRMVSAVSVTPEDGGLLRYIDDYLTDFETIWVNREGVKNIFLTKAYGAGKHLCFAGHVDVVPPGDGWSSDPFMPVIKDGYIYGRGTQDMKSGVAAFVQAVRDAGEQFPGRLSILLTSDEEGEGQYGTRLALQHLKTVGLLPDYCIIAEPTCERLFGDAIKIGRRGSINGCLTVKGRQGHAAYPEKAINPIHHIAPILPQLADHKFDYGDENFAPSQLIITDIRSGLETTNVTPNELKLLFNVRNSTQTTLHDIRAFLEQRLGNLDYELTLRQSALPFVTNKDSLLVKTLSRAVEAETGRKPKLSTAGGTSDGRYMAAYGVEVVEFGVINDRIHGVNERTSIKEVESLYQVFVDVIKQFGA